MQELIALIILAVIATVVHLNGVKSGRDMQRKEQAGQVEEHEGRIADAELEAERNKPIGDRLRDLRDRILQRRGSV